MVCLKNISGVPITLRRKKAFAEVRCVSKIEIPEKKIQKVFYRTPNQYQFESCVEMGEKCGHMHNDVVVDPDEQLTHNEW